MSDRPVTTSSFLNRIVVLVRRAAPIVVVACGASMLTLAIRPPKAPIATTTPESEYVLAAPGDILGGRGDGTREARLGPVTDEEWKEAERFFSDYAPVRLEEIRRLKDGEPGTYQKRALVARYRALQKVKAESSDLYETQLQEVKINDQVLRICLDIKARGRDKRLTSELNARVTELFNLGLVDRKLRITQVEKSLGDQKKFLALDEQNKVERANEQYKFILVHGVDGAKFDNGPKRVFQKPKSGATTNPSSPGEVSPGEQ